ncbi:MAG: NAD-dependent epimerase/dehydratase family protein [Candidatus Micrarchaeota archaeon]|nr:NAD-dependent epimerase/dehydratase family protein [Candidatus Micrarchaeota archaeon]
MSFWDGKNVMVTGGASFIGSHLVDDLIALGANVSVVDDLSSGKLANLTPNPRLKFKKMDLETASMTAIKKVFKGNEVLFHLAAVHGGRGYIDTHPADCSSNFAIDHRVFDAACASGVERVAFASSACAYPPRLQESFSSDYLLKESDSDIGKLKEPLSADLEYGWAKLMGEVQLRSFVRQYGMKGVNLRFVTAYGPRENETHAIVALIHKAHERMDPYEIWGTGEQSRDFTYVTDIVTGTILAAEKVSDGGSINLGTGVRYRLKDVAEEIFGIMDWRPKGMKFDPSKPTGVVSRALDISRASRLLGWEPKVGLKEGLQKTIGWYTSTHKRKGRINEKILLER